MFPVNLWHILMSLLMLCTDAGDCKPVSLNVVTDSLTVLILYLELQMYHCIYTNDKHRWS